MEFDIKKIRELMGAMSRAGVSRLKLKEGESEIELERSGPKGKPEAPPPHAHHQPVEVAPAAAHASLPGPAHPPAPEGRFVTAPMVGTFYGAASPEAEAFVKVGDKVTEDTVVCILEAMKVMNEVKAGKAGTIAEILVESGHPVEFGTNLYRIT